MIAVQVGGASDTASVTRMATLRPCSGQPRAGGVEVMPLSKCYLALEGGICLKQADRVGFSRLLPPGAGIHPRAHLTAASPRSLRWSLC